jgi:hypothetical protein
VRISISPSTTDQTDDPHTIVPWAGPIMFRIYNSIVTDPQLKAAWELGETDRFYPYREIYAQVFGEQE